MGSKPIDRYAVCPATGCWNWTGPIMGNGYPNKIKRDKRGVSAHRFHYELRHGPVPAGLWIDHLCRNRRCVNPSHMEAVTPRENHLRSESASALNARKILCKRWHQYDRFTTQGTNAVHRICGKCKRITRRERNDRNQID